MAREELLALPPTTDLRTLARALGLSEPTLRELRRNGELEHMGIRVNRLGAKYVVVTETLLEYLGIKRTVNVEVTVQGSVITARELAQKVEQMLLEHRLLNPLKPKDEE